MSQTTTIKKETNKMYVDITDVKANLKEGEISFVWLNPVDMVSVSYSAQLTIRLGVYSNTPVAKFAILVNNMPNTPTRGFKMATSTGFDKFDKYIEAPITLSDGDNKIQIVVSNEFGTTANDFRAINYKAASEEALVRTDYALLFATDIYNEWDNLVNPVNDAETIADELEKYYGFKVDLVTNATTEEIMYKIREYGKKSYLPYDQLLIFFAGHGQYDDVYKEGYIVGKNSKKSDVTKSTYLAHSQLRNAIENIPTEHTLLVMDACFGGTFDPLISKASSRGGESVYDEISQNEYIKRKLRIKTRQYITSGGKEYVPDGVAGMHSPFARKFIEALRSYGGKDKILNISEVRSFVEKINPEPRGGEFGSNKPGSDFIFIVKD